MRGMNDGDLICRRSFSVAESAGELSGDVVEDPPPLTCTTTASMGGSGACNQGWRPNYIL